MPHTHDDVDYCWCDAGSTYHELEDRDRRPEDSRNCPDCGGTGTRTIPIKDDWGDVEYTVERTCSFCGGSGWFYSDTAMELEAEGVWYDNPSY